MSDVLVVGGGPAGMIAAYAAAKNGHRVTLLEKNEKLGKKLYITGKGRCNVTNAADMETIMNQVVSNPRFLYSAFDSFSNEELIALLEQAGCPCKIERGMRVFPESDHSADVLDAMRRLLKKAGVQVELHTTVSSLWILDGRCAGVRFQSGTKRAADAVIVATGGLSYPSTGSTGDGLRFAQECGLQVTEVSPALVPLETAEEWSWQLQGLSLKNVTARILDGKKCLFEELGELLFTHFGVSGPLMLSASSLIAKKLKKGPLLLEIDLKPALSEEQLDARLLREFEQVKNRQFQNALGSLYPKRLLDTIVLLSQIAPDKQVNGISREERHRILQLTKKLPLTITGLRDYNEAIITQGGISVREINPSTMESKKIPGLYFAGEVLDLDARTGGYNLQIAWSTGYLAGSSVS